MDNSWAIPLSSHEALDKSLLTVFIGMNPGELPSQTFWCSSLTFAVLCCFIYHNVGICQTVLLLWKLTDQIYILRIDHLSLLVIESVHQKQEVTDSSHDVQTSSNSYRLIFTI